MRRFGLETAEEDGTLNAVGSTYSHENNAVYDGISRTGTRLVSFAPVLKHGLFPLADLLDFLIRLGSWGTSTDVEIEFAVNLDNGGAKARVRFPAIAPPVHGGRR